MATLIKGHNTALLNPEEKDLDATAELNALYMGNAEPKM